MSKHKIHIEDLRGGQPFQIPGAYFRELKGAIARNTFLIEEGKLEKTVSESPFMVEEYYFNKLQQDIRSRTYERRTSVKWRLSAKHVWVALPVVACFFIGFFFVVKPSNEAVKEFVAEREVIHEYLLSEASSDELTEHLLAMKQSSDSLFEKDAVPLKGIPNNYVEEELLDDLSE